MGQVAGVACCSSDGLANLIPPLPTEAGVSEADQMKTFHVEPLPGMHRGIAKYSGVCLGRDGRLYYCPYEADCVAVYNAESKELGFIHHPRLRGPKKYLGICAGPDGRLYCAPANACNVMVITPGAGLREEALSFIDGLGGGEDKYGGICMAPSGVLCCCPYTSDSALVINPWTQQFSHVNGVGQGYVGICMAADGLLYCAPFQAPHVLVLNLEAEEGRQVSFIEGYEMVGGGRYIGIAAAPNGKLYCAPWNASEVLVIDPRAQEDKLSFIGGAGEGDSKYHGLCCAADGRLYCAPYRESRVLVVDPIVERLVFTDELCEDRATFRGICPGASGGWLYVAPWDSPNLLAVKMLSSR